MCLNNINKNILEIESYIQSIISYVQEIRLVWRAEE